MGTDLVPMSPPQPATREAPLLERALDGLLRLLLAALWWLLRQAGRVLWRYRDLHTPWWVSGSVWMGAVAAHAGRVPWWIVAGGFLLAAAVAHLAEQRFDRLPVEAGTLTGAVIALGGLCSAGEVWGPVRPVNVCWAAVTGLVWTAWWQVPAYRSWRHLRLRVRNWQAALPAVLAELGAPAVVVTKVVVDGTGRVMFHLRLPVKVTRRMLEKLRDEIISGMHWPDGSVREIVRDDAHSSAARVVLVWQDGHIAARHVAFDPTKIPAGIHDPLWLGVDDQGRDVLVEQYAREGMTRGMYGGEPGSAKSNLLRLIARLRAYNPDTLLWVIDRKNSGNTFASLLPRIDWIATTREEAIMMLQAAAAGIPLRGRLLRPEHNQLLPLSPQVPGVVILYDEFAGELGRQQKNRAAVEAALTLASQGRATGWGAEIASQYLSKTSLDPDLRPLFPRSFAGRTRTRADAQFLLKQAHRIDTTTLPTGAFYAQLPGKDHPVLLFTPEMTDVELAKVAAETAHLAPTLEESTAAQLPHYAGRWGRLPDHLLQYCSDAQRAMVEAARSVPSPAPLRTAAAGRARLVVHERVDALTADVGDVAAQLSAGEFGDEPTAAMCELLLSRDEVTTGELDAAAAPRSRQWASERRAEWRERGLIAQVGRGRWALICRDRGALGAGVRDADRVIRSRRSSRGGDGQ
jgi:hypothetical protein